MRAKRSTSGELDRFAAWIVRHAARSVILSDIDAGKINAQPIDGPLLFRRLWKRLGVDAVLTEELEGGEAALSQAAACWQR